MAEDNRLKSESVAVTYLEYCVIRLQGFLGQHAQLKDKVFWVSNMANHNHSASQAVK